MIILTVVKNDFSYFLAKNMLWVLKRTIQGVGSFEHPKPLLKPIG